MPAHARQGTAIARTRVVNGMLRKAHGRRRNPGRPASAPRVTSDRRPDGRSPVRDLRYVRRAIAMVALLLAGYCLIAATTALYAQPAPSGPDPEALAARERHLWPGLIPVVFLALVAGYAVAVAARRHRRTRSRPGPPSTQDPPPATRPADDRRGDTASSRRHAVR